MRTEALACKYYVENNELTKENVAIYNQSLDKVVEYSRRIEEGKSGYSSYWFCVWYDSDVEKFDVITIDK